MYKHLRGLTGSALCSSVLCLLVGCGGQATESNSASATLAPLGSSTVTGRLTFTEGEGNVTISGTLSGLGPGTQHGFHIHETGDCGDTTAPDGTVTPGGAAGGHWNPAGHMHGAPEAQSHLGDLGNLMAGAMGNAAVQITRAGISIGDGSMTDVTGRAVIVHANPDDLTSQPTGNAGGRIACGVVQ